MNETQKNLDDLERELLQAWTEDRLEEVGASLSAQYPEHAMDLARITLALAREDMLMDIAAAEAFSPTLADLRARSGIKLRTLSQTFNLPKLLFDRLETVGSVRGIHPDFISRLAIAMSAAKEEIFMAIRTQLPQSPVAMSHSMVDGQMPSADTRQSPEATYDFADLLREAGVDEKDWTNLYDFGIATGKDSA